MKSKHLYGECNDEHFCEGHNYEDRLNGSLIYDSIYEDGATFYTNENFGCIHFKPNKND